MALDVSDVVSKLSWKKSVKKKMDTENIECFANSLESQCSLSTQPRDPDHLLKVDFEVIEWASMTLTGESVGPTNVDVHVKSILKDLNPKKAPRPDKSRIKS